MKPFSRSLLFVVLGLSTHALAQGEVEARSAVKKGGDVWLIHESTMDASGQVQGQDLHTNENVAYTVHLQVTDVDAEGNYRVDTKIVRVRGKVTMAMGQGEFELDSAATDDEPAAAGQGSPMERQMKKGLLAAVGMSFQCKVGPTGQLLELGTGTKQILDNPIRPDVMHALNEAALRQLVEAAFGVVPQKRTASGARWQQQRTMSYGRMPTKQKLDLSLTNVDPDFFEIETTGTLDIDKEAAAKDAKAEGNKQAAEQLANTKVQNTKLTGKQRTSRKDGFVIEATSQVSMDWETSDAHLGDVTLVWKLTASTKRTTAEAAMPKKAAEKKDEKPK